MSNPTYEDIKNTVTKAFEVYHPGNSQANALIINDIARDITNLIQTTSSQTEPTE